MLDRTREVHFLDRSLHTAQQGRGQLVIVTGGPGSGKTEFLHNFLEKARNAGAGILLATSTPAEHTTLLSTFAQLVHESEALRGEDAGPTAHPAELPREHTRDAAPDAPAAHAPGRRTAAAVDNDIEALLALDRIRPLVIAIDDAHLMDTASLATMSKLLRRIRNRRVLAVCASWGQSGVTGPRIHRELTRLPHRRLRLAPLSPGAVALMLARQVGSLATDEVSAAYHQVTGGNPMLIQALLDDSTRFGSELGHPRPSTVYRQAVLTCLHSGTRAHARVAAALAALGEHATSERVPPLTGDTPAVVSEAVNTLGAIGLLDGHRYRHQEAALAVLGDLPAEECLKLHGEVARMRHHQGAPATEVARHLLAADRVTEPWGMSVLRKAADLELDEDVRQSTAYLHLALRHSTDPDERNALAAALGRAEWRVNPAAAGTHLAPLRDALAADALGAHDAATVLRYMLWQGELKQVSESVARLRSPGSSADAQVIAEVDLVRQWFYGIPRPVPRNRVLKLIGSQDLNGLGPKVAKLIGGADTSDVAATTVVQMLRCHRIDEMKPELASLSLLALANMGMTRTAADACDALIARVVRGGATTWQALLTAVRAEIALLQGDLETAEEKAVKALDMMHPQAWGVLIGLPLATAICARTRANRHEDAERLLRRPVPEAMLPTVFGVLYVRARGHHYLATDQTFAALDDFETCARQMREAYPDLQKGIPWRIDLAQAHLRLGDVKTAKEHAEEQLRLPGSQAARSRAMALQTLASVSKAHHRTTLLREAIDLLKSCGDRLLLAEAFADLSAAHYELGDYARARLVAQQATQESDPVPVAPRVEAPRPEPAAPFVPTVQDAAPVLSDAERRVARFAALGYTNREISARLHVTISTVEQHLTRVYRKLQVASRADLPSMLLDRVPAAVPQQLDSTGPRAC